MSAIQMAATPCEVKCDGCGAAFIGNSLQKSMQPKVRAFCSSPCRLNHARFEVKCDNCSRAFLGSYKKHWRQQQGCKTFCGTACKNAFASKKFRKHTGRDASGRLAPERGPCKTCGKMYHSHGAKIYCSMTCYMADEEAIKRLTEQVKHAAAKITGVPVGSTCDVQCPQCGKIATVPFGKRNKKKYCNNVCRRAYFAARFDRFIANPEGIALPQCYDEFLDRESLPCLFEGCQWVGKHLSAHVNFAHGVTASDFKEMAGFNNTTGLVSKDVAQSMSERAQQWSSETLPLIDDKTHRDAVTANRSKIRLEGREHLRKVFALNNQQDRLKSGYQRMLASNPEKVSEIKEKHKVHAINRTGAFATRNATCSICSKTFESTILLSSRSNAYCSSECSAVASRMRETAKTYKIKCGVCHNEYLGTRAQSRKAENKKPTFCSRVCQNIAIRERVANRPRTQFLLTCFSCGCEWHGDKNQKANMKRGRRLRCPSCRDKNRHGSDLIANEPSPVDAISR